MSDEEQKKIEIGVGVAGEPPADAEIIPLTKPGEEDEVGGRAAYITNVGCPYCWSVNRIVANTNFRQWYSCWNCGGAFHY